MDTNMMEKKLLLLRRPLPPSELIVPSPPSNEERKVLEMERALQSAASAEFDSHFINQRDFYIYPLLPKGPAPLPVGKVIRTPIIDPASIDNKPVDGFTFNDFLVSNEAVGSSTGRLIKSCPMVSRENYLKMTSWFANNSPQQTDLHISELQIDEYSLGTRKPYHQMIIEFQAILMDLTGNNADNISEDDVAVLDEDLLIHSARSRFFCGLERSSTPFDDSGNKSVGLAEVAILNSMIYGGVRLSLKAQFLSELPNLLPLAKTLIHLNLSFNNLEIFPIELCHLTQLQELILRNNPIKELPSAIKSLQKLQILSAPFNLLTDLPPGLFEILSLKELDVSHNSIQWISNDISHLKNLKRLNIECNQLSGLPSSFLSLSLQQLQADSNYFHPLLWKENTHNQPQTLSDLCSIVLAYNNINQLPTSIQKILNNPTSRCDYCQGPIYGCGLRLIRSVQETLYNIKHLPFIFEFCSVQCHTTIRRCECDQLKWIQDHLNIIR